MRLLPRPLGTSQTRQASPGFRRAKLGEPCPIPALLYGPRQELPRNGESPLNKLAISKTNGMVRQRGNEQTDWYYFRNFDKIVIFDKNFNSLSHSN